MHIAQPHTWDETGFESDNSEYDKQPGDIGIPDLIPSRRGPMTQNQKMDHQLAKSMWETWTKAIQCVQHK